MSLSNTFDEFLKKSEKKATRVLNLCSNSELFQRQKVDLVSRTNLKTKDFEIKYICIGSVKLDTLNHENVGQENDSVYNYELREKYFRFAAEQRQIISDDQFETNIKSFTIFSIIFDLFNSNHQSDIKKFKLPQVDDGDFDELAKLGEQSSFILYNCARLHAIFEKFQACVNQGRVQFNHQLILKTLI